jgi:hypothetical protein
MTRRLPLSKYYSSTPTTEQVQKGNNGDKEDIVSFAFCSAKKKRRERTKGDDSVTSASVLCPVEVYSEYFRLRCFRTVICCADCASIVALPQICADEIVEPVELKDDKFRTSVIVPFPSSSFATTVHQCQ